MLLLIIHRLTLGVFGSSACLSTYRNLKEAGPLTSLRPPGQNLPSFITSARYASIIGIVLSTAALRLFPTHGTTCYSVGASPAPLTPPPACRPGSSGGVNKSVIFLFPGAAAARAVGRPRLRGSESSAARFRLPVGCGGASWGHKLNEESRRRPLAWFAIHHRCTQPNFVVRNKRCASRPQEEMAGL